MREHLFYAAGSAELLDGPMSADRDLHALALFVHGALVFGHVLGVAYGIVRRNKSDAVIHFAGVLFSVRCARHHLRQCR